MQSIHRKLYCSQRRCRIVAAGEVAEWLMAPVLKTGVPERVPGVRIPPSPPEILNCIESPRPLPRNALPEQESAGTVCTDAVSPVALHDGPSIWPAMR